MGDGVKPFRFPDIPLGKVMVTADEQNIAAVLSIASIPETSAFALEMRFDKVAENTMLGFSGHWVRKAGLGWFIETDSSWFDRQEFYPAQWTGTEWRKA